MSKRSAIVIGAGIVGLATARALDIKGYSVTVFERTHKAASSLPALSKRYAVEMGSYLDMAFML